MSLYVVCIYFVVWALVHSALASHVVKRWASHILGQDTMRWYRLAFNVFALATFLPIIVIVFLYPDEVLYSVPAPWIWFMRSAQVLISLGMIRILQRTGFLHLLGLSQLQSRDFHLKPVLQVRGMYRYVRHPLYTLSIALIWLTPTMSWNRLTLYMLMCLYFIIGSIHEEKLVVAEFGGDYVSYRKQVPRLVPSLTKHYRR